MSLFNKLVVTTLPVIPKGIVKLVARRYIAGPLLADAIQVSEQLMLLGASSTIDVLGEFVESANRAQEETQMSKMVIDAIRSRNLNSYLSVKPTSLGLNIDSEIAYRNITEVVAHARASGVFVRMDMENTPFTSATLDFYKRLRRDGFDNVGVVIQAYLRRSEADVLDLLQFKPSVRLCKGIYQESEELAFRDADEIRSNYKKLLRVLIDGGARTHIATHDEELLADAEQQIARQHLNPAEYEFQMLMGVREERRDKLIKDGHSVRIYVPFGHDWYGYSTRRLKENPQVAGYIAKAIFTRR
ncbi:MAG: proline dehydrogenase family protein [Ignavibacteria bacterium]|nr:proline dehydrogenase family protein [Ignavibacteria bacterium]